MSEPEGTIRDVLLTEPGSNVEGPTEDVLRVVFWTVHELLEESGMTAADADPIALILMARLHDGLDSHGYVIRADDCPTHARH
jgi:uncharacterized protein YabE (DUF348 family)